MRVYPSMLLSKGRLILLSLEVSYNPSMLTTEMSMGLSEDQAMVSSNWQGNTQYKSIMIRRQRRESYLDVRM
jgi:hypothetical protein